MASNRGTALKPCYNSPKYKDRDDLVLEIIDLQDGLLTLEEVAAMLQVHPETLRRWDRSGELPALKIGTRSDRRYSRKAIARLLGQKISTKLKVISLFSGCGGFDLGFQGDFEFLGKYYPPTGFTVVWANDSDAKACLTYRSNFKTDCIVCGDLVRIARNPRKLPSCDVIVGGFPCQDFSIAGKKRGLETKRGRLYLAMREIVLAKKPFVFIAENVGGLLTLKDGAIIDTIQNDFAKAGYKVSFDLYNTVDYGVPQKRKRLLIVGIRNDLHISFIFPKGDSCAVSVREALKSCPFSLGEQYSEKKRRILELVPPGGYWRDLPIELQKEYMGASFYLGGGKTGMARRLSWDEPSLTLTCAPAQKQTERCHPEETRPLTVREYARLQTFPDAWEFMGSTASQYKQIGNAVPPVFAWRIAESLMTSLMDI